MLSVPNMSSEKEIEQATEAPPPKKIRYDVDEYNDIVEETDKSSEVQFYRNQIITDLDPKSVLDYWKSKERLFPILSTVTRQVFSVKATSSASERNFSHAGTVVSKRRTCLSSNYVNNILFLNSSRRVKRSRE